MKRVILITELICCVSLTGIAAVSFGQTNHRIVTISSLCLCDEANCRTSEYVLESLDSIPARRTQHDMIVLPLMPLSDIPGRTKKPTICLLLPILPAKYKTYVSAAMAEIALDGRIVFYLGII